MPKVIAGIIAALLCLSSLSAWAPASAEPTGRKQTIPTEFYRDPVPACRQDFDLPEVHNLPMGVGDVSVKKCYNNGFTTITPHTERVDSCLIAVKSQAIIDRGNIAYDQGCLRKVHTTREDCEIDCKDTPQGLKSKPECTPGKVRMIRRKYHCRFKGAGAVLGGTGEARTSGSRVFFRGEEPKNFKTKDPSCRQIFDDLFTKQNKYGYLE